jgi:hypothetical protein
MDVRRYPVLRAWEFQMDILFYSLLMVAVVSIAAATWALLRGW